MKSDSNQEVDSQPSPQRRDAVDQAHTGVGLENWNDGFPTTHWSLLLDSDGQGQNCALSKMCSAYWYPLYAYLRKTGHSGHDAQDLTQGFFAHLFSADRLSEADPHRGRFRSYLLGALKHYLSDVRKHQSALKRGGGIPPVSIEQELAEERYQSEPADPQLTAERLFDRQWALEIFRQILKQVEHDYREAGKGKLFETLHPYLTGEADRGTYGAAAQTLEVKEVTIRSLVSRLRKHYRKRMRERVELLVDAPEEADAEIQYLFELM